MTKQKKIKEPVKLRQKKIKNGFISLYLDIYYKGIRKYDFLNLYIKANPTNSDEREKNASTIAAAIAIKNKRITQIQNDQYGLMNRTLAKDMLFVDYFEIVKNRRADAEATRVSYDSTLKHVKDYIHPGTTFENVTESFIRGFKDYLNKVKNKQGNPLAQNTKNTYFSKFRTVISDAMSIDHILPENPGLGVPVFAKEESKREYLTHDQIQKLAQAECRIPLLKKRFLFGYLTGLRWSDIDSLTVGEIQDFNSRKRIIFRQEKTNGLEYLDLNDQAVQLMGSLTDKDPNDFVFSRLKYNDVITNALNDWCLRAGILNKHITFHSSRHSFAVNMLDRGVDLYTLSKLMGHKSIKSTEIYAKILDKNKIKAVDSIPKLDIKL